MNKKYAIVDIETTGSPASTNGITEIAVVLHDGKEIEGRFETLINPGISIPPYVAHLTRINNVMVASAPPFTDVAGQLHNLLQDRIFVAHNVAFDYPFLQYNFNRCGIDYASNKLCTIKLSRKAFPGLQRYGLDFLCETFDIPLTNQHRAGGDAVATTIIFDRILKNGGGKLIEALTEPPVAYVLPKKKVERKRKIFML